MLEFRLPQIGLGDLILAGLPYQPRVHVRGKYVTAAESTQRMSDRGVE